MSASPVPTNRPKIGSIVFTPEGKHVGKVIPTPQEIRCPQGCFVVESDLGFRTIGSLSGKTRRQFGMTVCKMLRLDIDTIADPDGSIWGVPGERRDTTCAVRWDVVEFTV